MSRGPGWLQLALEEAFQTRLRDDDHIIDRVLKGHPSGADADMLWIEGHRFLRVFGIPALTLARDAFAPGWERRPRAVIKKSQIVSVRRALRRSTDDGRLYACPVHVTQKGGRTSQEMRVWASKAAAERAKADLVREGAWLLDRHRPRSRRRR